MGPRSAGFARPGCCSPRTRCCETGRGRAARRSAGRSRATSAAAPATRRSSTRSRPARREPPVAESPAATRERLRVVGRRLPRHDARDKVLARTLYAADWQMPGMLEGAVLRSPYPAARITRIDTSRAAACPGVAAVLTARDVPHNILWTDVPGQTSVVGPLRARVQVLADDQVRYQGEAVALVAAETREIADRALELIDVAYEAQPGVFTTEDALRPDAPRVHEEGNVLATWRVRCGDADTALARAHAVVEQTYRCGLIDHAYLEPEAGVAWIDADGVVVVRASTQVIEHFRDVADVLGLPHNKVRVIGPYVGGGFGGKEDVTVEVFLGLLAYRTGRPVRMVWSRQESLLARPKRHPFTLRYRTGAARDGTLLAHRIELTADAGAYAYLSALVLLYATVTAAGPYRVPHVAVDARAVYTNNPPTSAMRGFGAMQMVLGYESQIDQIARRLGLDPVEVRRRSRRWTRTSRSPRRPSGPGPRSARRGHRRARDTASAGAWPATCSPTAASCGSGTGRAPGWGSRPTAASWCVAASRTSAGGRPRRCARSPRRPSGWSPTGSRCTSRTAR